MQIIFSFLLLMKACFENPPPSLYAETEVTGVNEDAQWDIIAVKAVLHFPNCFLDHC